MGNQATTLTVPTYATSADRVVLLSPDAIKQCELYPQHATFVPFFFLSAPDQWASRAREVTYAWNGTAAFVKCRLTRSQAPGERFFCSGTIVIPKK